MGMAASQARYLALVARKSNCEYEGQQINQARLALSNQSSDLFNQMMGLEVPKTPSKTDFTYTTYTFDDGDYVCTIDKWNHLADSESDGYNYAVTYHYDKTDNIGFQRYKHDPQIQFSLTVPAATTDPTTEIEKIEAALEALDSLKRAAKEAETARSNALSALRNTTNYKSNLASAILEGEPTDTEYTVRYVKTPATETEPAVTVDLTYTRIDAITDQTKKDELNGYIKALIDNKAITAEDAGQVTDEQGNIIYTNIFYDTSAAAINTDTIAFKKDLNAIKTTAATLPVYRVATSASGEATIKSALDDLAAADEAYQKADIAYKQALDDVYKQNNIPYKMGNIKLEALSKNDLDENTAAAIAKIINQMSEDKIENNLIKCFNTLTNTYDSDTYVGGIYKYTQAATTYYVTYYDLLDSVVSGTGVNNIDDQKKLPCYGTQDAEVKVEKTSRALIEKDRSGRFVTIKFEDDSFVYDLKAVTETDEIAYEDAMNEANYQKALYDKKVQDINAMTSLIQRQDQALELRLKQLDTEQNALATEIDAVSKVVKDNVEKSFKTFGG